MATLGDNAPGTSTWCLVLVCCARASSCLSGDGESEGGQAILRSFWGALADFWSLWATCRAGHDRESPILSPHSPFGSAYGRQPGARRQHPLLWGPSEQTEYFWRGLHALARQPDPRCHVWWCSTSCSVHQSAGSDVPGTQRSVPCGSILLGALLLCYVLLDTHVHMHIYWVKFDFIQTVDLSIHNDVNTLRPEQYCSFKMYFLTENYSTLIKISMEFVPYDKGYIIPSATYGSVMWAPHQRRGGCGSFTPVGSSFLSPAHQLRRQPVATSEVAL